jgi:hypothetical protein
LDAGQRRWHHTRLRDGRSGPQRRELAANGGDVRFKPLQLPRCALAGSVLQRRNRLLERRETPRRVGSRGLPLGIELGEFGGQGGKAALQRGDGPVVLARLVRGPLQVEGVQDAVPPLGSCGAEQRPGSSGDSQTNGKDGREQARSAPAPAGGPTAGRQALAMTPGHATLLVRCALSIW